VLLLTTGCAARRTLTITSEPPGAAVRLDDELVGETPLVLPFEHYGTRRVTFYRAGFLTESFVVEVAPPWYARFPADFLTEVLFPIGWRDDHPVHADLRAGDDVIGRPTLRSVLERAEILRRAGPAGPRRLPTPENEERTDEEASGGPEERGPGASSAPARP
jgi:hypothetical protein